MTGLGFGFTFADLAARDGLARLDQVFVAGLAAADTGLHARLMRRGRCPMRCRSWTSRR